MPTRDRATQGGRLVEQLSRLDTALAARKEAQSREGLPETDRLSVQLTLDRKAFAVVQKLDEIAEIEILQQSEDGLKLLLKVEAGGLARLQRHVLEYLDPSKDGENSPAYAAFLDAWEAIEEATFDQFWRDAPSRRPQDPQEVIWWEVWLWAAPGMTLTAVEAGFRETGVRLGLQVRPEALRFPERSVVLVFGSEEAMRRSVELLDSIAALYRADEAVGPWVEDLDVTEQREFVDELACRVVPASGDAPAVCLLDTGVTANHALLRESLEQRHCLASHGGYDWQTPPKQANRRWGARPEEGHGTAMAGLALFGERLQDLLASREAVVLSHVLESVRVRPEVSADFDGELARRRAVEPELWGQVTINAVDMIEALEPERRRVFCHTVTDQRGRDANGLTEDFGSGLPGSWSGAVDQLAFAADGPAPRLFVQSAGNLILKTPAQYPALNESSPVEPPGQAWNALTVGAMTQRVVLDGRRFPGQRPVVRRRGALGPESRTSLVWDAGTPIKPELVLEGGNLAAGAGEEPHKSVDDLRLLSTYFQPDLRLLTTTGDTSASAALCARAAATLGAAYPSLWPETLRGLLVHSAEWTDAMLAEALGDRQENLVGDRRADLLRRLSDAKRIGGLTGTQRKRTLLRTVGYGVPDLDRALAGASNSVTMIVQDEIQPFAERDAPAATPGFAGMHLHDIACWPGELLRSLGETPVTMRVTLSYFIEPSPSGRPNAYASHGLRFDVRRPLEADNAFFKRISRVVEEGAEPGESSGSSPRHRWLLGPRMQSAGSIHSDWWSGNAVDLVRCGYLAVYPVSGWWRTRRGQRKWAAKARYALIVSLSTPAQDVPLYNEVLALLRPEIQVFG